MKIFHCAVLVSFFIFITGSTVSGIIIHEKQLIDKVLKTLRDNMGNSFTLLGMEIPPLDPLDIFLNATVPLKIYSDVVIDIGVGEINATGLKTFVVDEDDAYIVASGQDGAVYIPLRLYIPKLSATVKYESDIISVDGEENPLNLIVNGIVFQTNISMTLGDKKGNDMKHLYLQSLGLQIEFDSVDVNVGNALDDENLEEVVNAALDVLVPQLWKTNRHDVFQSVLQTVKNNFDGKFTFQDLLQM